MKRLKTAVFGAGFMGKVHSEAIRRLGFVDIVGVAAVSDEEARSFGNAIGVERTTSNYKELLADPTIDAVHVCTPNDLHAPMSKDALLAGKAVLCEKPLTHDVSRKPRNWSRSRRQKNLPNCVNHNLRYYPAVQQIRADDRQRRPGRNSHRPGNLLPGLAALRHRLQLARRARRPTARCARWATSARTGWT